MTEGETFGHLFSFDQALNFRNILRDDGFGLHFAPMIYDCGVWTESVAICLKREGFILYRTVNARNSLQYGSPGLRSWQVVWLMVALNYPHVTFDSLWRTNSELFLYSYYISVSYALLPK